jgi:exosortase
VTAPTVRWTALSATAAAILIAIAALPVVFWIIEVWLGGVLGGGAAGLLTIPICCVLVWLASRRPAWQTETPDRPGAAALMCIAVIGYGVGLVLSLSNWDALMLCGALLPVMVWSWIWGVLGIGKAKALAFPVGFSLFALPYEHFLRRSIDIPLQIWSADISAFLLRLADYPIKMWNAFTIYTDEFYVIVNETCSGMNMIITLSMYTLIFGWATQPSFRNRIYLILLIFPTAMLANGVRISVIYLMGHHGDQALAMGPWHTRSAYLIFLPVFWFIYVVNNALTRRYVARQKAATPARSAA